LPAKPQKRKSKKLAFNFSFLPLPHGGQLMLCSLPREEADFRLIATHTQKLISLTQEAVSSPFLEIIHLPTKDFAAPSIQAWAKERAKIHHALKGGQIIAIHCHAGLGRTGTLAAVILMEQGMKAQTAINYVRQYRQGAIESMPQSDFIQNYPFAQS
jgi:protein tyrosine phosphatase